MVSTSLRAGWLLVYVVLVVLFGIVVAVPVALVLGTMYLRDNGPALLRNSLQYVRFAALAFALLYIPVPGIDAALPMLDYVEYRQVCVTTENTSECYDVPTTDGLTDY